MSHRLFFHIGKQNIRQTFPYFGWLISAGCYKSKLGWSFQAALAIAFDWVGGSAQVSWGGENFLDSHKICKIRGSGDTSSNLAKLEGMGEFLECAYRRYLQFPPPPPFPDIGDPGQLALKWFPDIYLYIATDVFQLLKYWGTWKHNPSS